MNEHIYGEDRKERMMKAFQIYKENTDEAIASFEEDERGNVFGIIKDGYKAKVDGHELIIEKPVSKETGSS